CRYFTDSRYIESAQNGLKGFEVMDIAPVGYIQRLNDAIADSGVEINRKVLADLAITDPKAFSDLVEVAKKALA
ncbi:MAG: hypothetical protein IIX62_02115, partial [Peptococcaceae bacterium]|nr:hypothetical protein [Peptococcaceae bacterium]